MEAIFENQFGQRKSVKLGFSWTTLFFGFLVPLVRGDMKGFLLLLVLDALISWLTKGIGTLAANLVIALYYNKFYIKELYAKGYLPIPEHEEAVLNYIS